MWLSRDRKRCRKWMHFDLLWVTVQKHEQDLLMGYSVGLGVVALLYVLIGTTSSSVSNTTDCRERSNESCSSFDLVGECNQTSGVCSCDVYNSTESIDNNTESIDNSTESIDCFFYDYTNNFCQVRKCWSFSNSSGRCRQTGKKRLTALLLSIFLINFGAANFYIERYDLAVPQIILGLLLCFFQFASCAVSAKRDDDTSKLCIFCCSVNSFFSLLLFSWWLADLVIFATNSRDDGDGCSLIT